MLIAITFAIHAALASAGKSSTYDEPVHAFSSWLIVNQSDFRVNPEHPALWKYVAGVGLIGRPLSVDFTDPNASRLLQIIEMQWRWTLSTLYRINPIEGDGEALVARARIAMALFPALLALVVARWAWVWGGPIAALFATALLSLDPNFLAHGALVTNDVAATLFITLAVYLTWRLGERFTWKRVLLLALVCACGAGTKFTCLLLAPMVAVPLLYRIFDRGQWKTRDRADIDSRIKRLCVVMASGITIILVTWALLWPMYLFRSDPTPEGFRFDDRYPRHTLGYYATLYAQERNPTLPPKTEDELRQAAQSYEPSLPAATFFWMTEKGLVPQAWGWGLNYANSRSILRGSYLLGETSNFGFTTFFPLAIVFKTPATTLGVMIVCLIGGVSFAARRLESPSARWKLVCLLVPPIIYFGVSCASNLNIGLRHILPIFPPMFVAAGVLIAHAVRTRKPGRLIAPAAVVLLAVETLSVFPNYLPFFNLPAGGSKGGLALLGDSNLDWGQDLKPLAEWYHDWRKDHPDEPFYLSYFGTVPPEAYRIDYINAAPGYDFAGTPPTMDLEGGVYAVSATHLQAMYSPGLRDAMASLRRRKPLATINDTIYIFEMPPARRIDHPATTQGAP